MEKENERYIKALVEKDEEGKLLAVASTDTVDREGESLALDGWDLENYKKNPVLLWSHDARELPIGTAKGIRVDKEKKAVTFSPVFHELTEKAKVIKQMYEGDPSILNAFSVGFLPTEQEGDHYLHQELLEISAVNVPANPQAMVMARSMFGEDTVNKLLNYDSKEVIPFASHPKASEDTPWTFSASDYDVGQLKTACAWYDSANADIKGSYKLPHHKPAGTTVWRGVAAAMAALMGARGGVNIPSGDIAGCKNHLAKHYKEFGKEVPKDLDEWLEKETETKSPMCRQANETKQECMSRKIPEIMKDDPSIKQDQAVAMANSMCSKPCKDCEVNTPEEKPKYIYVTKNDLIDKRLQKIEEHLAYISRPEKGTGRSDNEAKVNRRLIKALNRIVYKLDKGK